MGSLSWTHLLIIALLFVLLFGAKRLPDAARGLGRSLRIFKSEVSAMQKDEAQAPTAAAPVQQPAQQLPSGQSATTTTPAQPQADQKSA